MVDNVSAARKAERTRDTLFEGMLFIKKKSPFRLAVNFSQSQCGRMVNRYFLDN